jgi:phosphatidate cytidylyltransferase
MGWTLASIGLGFTLPLSMGSNLYRGMFWFLFPGFCVIFNDVFAYLFGMTMGKTMLIQLSPKKTVEGFMGGLCMTLVWGVCGTYLVSENPFFVCPKHDVGIIPFEQLQCEFPSAFKPQPFYVPFDVRLPFMETHFDQNMDAFIMLKPVIIHAMVISIFASLIAPFGGFFASGIKRAFNFKDFADTIPGHGGFTDRLDCHGLMGVFVMIYLSQVVFRPEHTM